MQTMVAPVDPDLAQLGLGALTDAVLESIPRADQRRWAECYVTGLATVPGRKSIRRIAAETVGAASPDSVTQCLQQFVNQSPWDWSAVRRDLSLTVAGLAPQRAWVLQEVEFVKGGRNSVGVWNQYAPALQRAVNCQLASAVWLAGDAGWVAANWRLQLPQGWNDDEVRRAKARVPECERHRPAWAQLLEVCDELCEWGLPVQPVVADRRHDLHHLDELVAGLEERGLPYLIQITERAPIAVHGRTGSVLRAGEVLRRQPSSPVYRTTPCHTPHPGAGPGRVVTAVVSAGPVARCAGTGLLGPRRIVHVPGDARSRGAGVWFTNIPVREAVELVRALDPGRRAVRELALLRTGSGLDHFEGRSFRGWHHHVTLTSIAHARWLRAVPAAPLPGGVGRGSARHGRLCPAS